MFSSQGTHEHGMRGADKAEKQHQAGTSFPYDEVYTDYIMLYATAMSTLAMHRFLSLTSALYRPRSGA